jgi:sterol desaturase/sphingolipid hydroxylase (fatty acid hydroxylase superfamily)
MSPALMVIGAGGAMLAVERFAPGPHWPEVPRWWSRAAALNSVQLAVVWLAGHSWDAWLARHRPWSAGSLGMVGGALAGYLAITFVYYWWHRWRHEIPVLWRVLHQLHHSPQRIEVVTSFYKHPLEILVNGILSSAILYLGVGLGVTSAVLVVLLSGLAELVYHWNVRTSYWLGFLFRRPESHCVHHQTGLHSFNYSDLPLWDALFGTLRNPRDWRERCGFGAAELCLGEMLLGIDVSSSPAGRGR